MTSELGSASSVFDDLRIVRSRGGFVNSRPPDLAGTIVFGKYRSLSDHVAHEMALADLQPFVQQELTRTAETAAPLSGRSIAAHSLEILLMNDGGHQLDFYNVRAKVGTTATRNPDYVRQQENIVLRQISRRFVERTAEPPKASGDDHTMDLISHTLVQVARCARRVVAYYENLNPNERDTMTWEFEEYLRDLVDELAVYIVRRRTLSREQPNSMITHVLVFEFDRRLTPKSFFGNSRKDYGDQEDRPTIELDLGPDSATIDVIHVWKQLRQYDRGIITGSECFIRSVSENSKWLAALLMTVPNNTLFADALQTIEVAIEV